MAKPSDDMIHRWHGGSCPLGVDMPVRVHLRYAPARSGRAGDFVWSHDLYNAYGAEDVVAYEILIDPAADGA